MGISTHKPLKSHPSIKQKAQVCQQVINIVSADTLKSTGDNDNMGGLSSEALKLNLQ